MRNQLSSRNSEAEFFMRKYYELFFCFFWSKIASQSLLYDWNQAVYQNEEE